MKNIRFEPPPKENPAPTAARWRKYLLAILLGNGLYFAFSPHLPAPARHEAFRLDLGTLVDFWFCLLVYGALELATFLGARRKD